MRPETPGLPLVSLDQVLLSLRERRCVLEGARVAAVQHLNCVLGGLAEIDLAIEQWEARAQGVAEEAEETTGAGPASAG